MDQEDAENNFMLIDNLDGEVEEMNQVNKHIKKKNEIIVPK